MPYIRVYTLHQPDIDATWAAAAAAAAAVWLLTRSAARARLSAAVQPDT
jgi:hypothetical protein